MLKIRLTRVGKSHSPVYRLVVAEKSRGVKREYIEILGSYNPCKNEDKFCAKKERVSYWISMGAEPSLTANNLLCDYGILAKDKKIKVIHGRSEKKKKIKEFANVEKVSTAKIAEQVKVGDDNKGEISGEEVVQEKEEVKLADNSNDENMIIDEVKAEKV